VDSNWTKEQSCKRHSKDDWEVDLGWKREAAYLEEKQSAGDLFGE
jgi:hypothetical protein